MIAQFEEWETLKSSLKSDCPSAENSENLCKLLIARKSTHSERELISDQ